MRRLPLLLGVLGALALGSTSATAAPATSTLALDGHPQVGTFTDGSLWIVEVRASGPALVEIDPARGRPTGRVVPLPAAAAPSPSGLNGRSTFSPSTPRPSLAVADGDLFLPAGPDVLQVDPERARVVRRIPFAARYVASGPAGLWAIGESTPTTHADGRPGLLWRLARIDPATGALEEHTIGPDLGSIGPAELAVTGASLWLAFPSPERRLVRVDAATVTQVPIDGYAGGAWKLFASGETLYGVSRYNDVAAVRRDGAPVGLIDMGLAESGLNGTLWRDLAAGPGEAVWAATVGGPGRRARLLRRALTGRGPVTRYRVGTDPVDVVPTPGAVWVLNAGDESLTRVRVHATVELRAQQLLVNQRIAQAAIRRLGALQAKVDGVPAPSGDDGRVGRVGLSIRQMRINQRISQAAVRRVNALTALVDGEPEPSTPSRDGGRLTLSARQLLINQRISQAAIRRVNALAERVPDLPVPRPPIGSPDLDQVVGVVTAPQTMRITAVRRGSAARDAVVAIVLPPAMRGATLSPGDTVHAEGIAAEGTFYGFHVTVEPSGP